MCVLVTRHSYSLAVFPLWSYLNDRITSFVFINDVFVVSGALVVSKIFKKTTNKTKEIFTRRTMTIYTYTTCYKYKKHTRKWENAKQHKKGKINYTKSNVCSFFSWNKFMTIKPKLYELYIKRDLIIIFCGLHISFKYTSVSPSRDQHCFYCYWPSVQPTNTKENEGLNTAGYTARNTL